MLIRSDSILVLCVIEFVYGHLQLLENGRTVVAAVRDGKKALNTLKETGGIVEGRQQSGGILFVESGIDVTNKATLTKDIFAGVSQVVCATGAVFGRDSEGNMGYLNGMTPQKVDGEGVASIAEAAAKFLPRSKKESKLIIPMSTETDLEKWQKLDDVIMGGNSSSELKLSQSGNGFTWKGELVVEGGGFCGARSLPNKMDLSAYDGVSLKVKGAGQTLKLNIKTDDLNEPEDTYQATFDVPDGEWGTVFIPWHEFVPVKRAKTFPGGPKLNPSSIIQFGLVYSRFSFNGFPNQNYVPGPFEIEFDSGIKAVTLPKPQIVLISSAGVERNALVGDNEEARKKEIPIVQLNPGGILNYKYDGEIAVRSSGLSYSVVRPTGMSDEVEQSGPARLEMSQGDSFTGKISRKDVADVINSSLNLAVAEGKTVEIRRSEAADAQGKSSDAFDILRLYLSAEKDANRTRAGLFPFPAPSAPPAPVSEERKQEILADPRVKAAAESDGRGGRVRDTEESDNADTITSMEDASSSPANEQMFEGKAGAREWIRQWRAQTLEKQLPEEANV